MFEILIITTFLLIVLSMWAMGFYVFKELGEQETVKTELQEQTGEIETVILNEDNQAEIIYAEESVGHEYDIPFLPISLTVPILAYLTYRKFTNRSKTNRKLLKRYAHVVDFQTDNVIANRVIDRLIYLIQTGNKEELELIEADYYNAFESLRKYHNLRTGYSEYSLAELKQSIEEVIGDIYNRKELIAINLAKEESKLLIQTNELNRQVVVTWVKMYGLVY